MSGEWLLTVDPGIHHCGWALWWDGGLVACDVSTVAVGSSAAQMAARVVEDMSRAIDGSQRRGMIGILVVCEDQQNYPGRNEPADRLEKMRAVVQALAPYKTVRPTKWKGNVPKHIHRGRIQDRLVAEERDRVPWDQDDAVDAVGLGLFVTGRAGRGGVR